MSYMETVSAPVVPLASSFVRSSQSILQSAKVGSAYKALCGQPKVSTRAGTAMFRARIKPQGSSVRSRLVVFS